MNVDNISLVVFAPSSADRLRAWDHCRRFWMGLKCERLWCRADEGDYWKAAVAHAGAEKATGDILIFVDADCLPDPRALVECIEAIESGAADVASPKTVTQRLTSEESEIVYDGGIPGKALEIQAYKAQDCGGVFIVSREFWERSGGMDLRFRGWGGEDGAYGAVCRSIGRVYRSDAVMYHLHHEPQPTKADNAYSTKAENNALHIQYLDAERAGTMAELLAERPEIQIDYEVQCDSYQ